MASPRGGIGTNQYKVRGTAKQQAANTVPQWIRPVDPSRRLTAKEAGRQSDLSAMRDWVQKATPDELRQGIRQHSGRLSSMIVESPDTPPEVLAEFLRPDAYPHVGLVARHGGGISGKRAAALGKYAGWVWASLLDNPKVTPEFVESFLAQPWSRHADGALQRIASEPQMLTPRAVDMLASNPNYRVAMASDPRLSPDIWQEALHDGDEATHLAALRNPQCPASILEEAAHRGDWAVRRAVIANPSAPAEALTTIAGDASRGMWSGDYKAMSYIVTHPNIPPEAAAAFLGSRATTYREMGSTGYDSEHYDLLLVQDAHTPTRVLTALYLDQDLIQESNEDDGYSEWRYGTRRELLVEEIRQQLIARTDVPNHIKATLALSQ